MGQSESGVAQLSRISWAPPVSPSGVHQGLGAQGLGAYGVRGPLLGVEDTGIGSVSPNWTPHPTPPLHVLVLYI